MADNDFIIPEIYTTADFETWANQNYSTSKVLGETEVVKNYYNFLGLEYDETNPRVLLLEKAVSFLPERFRRQNLLPNVDIRPLLESMFKYVESGKYLNGNTKYVTEVLDNVNSKYIELSKEFISEKGKQEGVTYTDIQLEQAATESIKTSTGFSPLQMDTNPIVGSDANKDMSSGPVSPNSPGYEPYSGTNVTPSSGPSINADGTFPLYAMTLAENNQIDYTEYLQEYATATVDDLLRLEAQTGMEKPNVFKSGEFITNLTGQVSAVNWADPNGGQTTWSLSEGVRYIYGLDTAKVTKLQKSLRDAGYFDKLGKFPAYGQPDDATALAWNLLLSDSVRNNQTPSARLKKSSEDFAKRMASGQGNLFLDEASVESAVLAIGSQVLGRGLDKTELDSLTTVVRNWEREAYKTSATGVGPEGDVFSQPDIEARINRYMQDTYREETVINSMPNNIKLLKQAFG